MTRLDPSPHRPNHRAWLEEERGREGFARHPGSKGEREQENAYLSPGRAKNSRPPQENSPSPPFRHSEVGRPLPSTRSPEPKASIPFRNPDLGVPSKRRSSETLDSDHFGSSSSPPKYPLHSNFRRGFETQGQPSPRSPVHASRSPTPFKQAESLGSAHRKTPKCHGHSYSPSNLHSGNYRSTPRQGSIPSRSSSPSRSPSPFKQSDSLCFNYDAPGFSQSRGEEPRSPHQNSHGQSLDSEKLYKNLKSIADLANSGSYARFRTSGRQTEITSRSRSSTRRDPRQERSPSPEYRRFCHQNRSPSPHMQRETSSQSSIESESSHISGGSGSAGMKREEYALMADIPKAKIIYLREGVVQGGRSQSRSPGREELKRSSKCSTAPDGHREWEPEERGRGKERGRNRQKLRNGEGVRRSHDHFSMRNTSQHSSTRPQRSTSPPREDVKPSAAQAKHPPEHMEMQKLSQGDRPDHSSTPKLGLSQDIAFEKPDLLNFKKGWMSKLDKNGEWRKHWFVLTDTGLRYYKDSKAEEKDDLDGEIDLKTCVKVSEFDVEKNYGFQIQTQEALFTLSAMTSGIRRNWVEVLRKTFLPSTSPDITQLADSGSDKENSLSHRRLSRQLPSQHARRDSEKEVTTSASTPHGFDSVELAPVAPDDKLSPPGETRGLTRRLEDRSRWFQSDAPGQDAGHSPWDAVMLKGSGPTSRVEEELARKWTEFERLPLREVRSLPPVGSRAGQSSSETLQREVLSLRQQVERLQREGGQCGPRAPCGRSLEAMERAHREALDELQKRHDRETRELENERDTLLREEAQATAQAMEVIRKALREELEEEVKRVRRLCRGGVDTQTLHEEQHSEMQALQRELDGMSERYSQKCLELKRAEQSSCEREQEMSLKETEVAQLRKENQELQTRLTEEISRMRSFITGEGSESSPHANLRRSSCELEVLLRVKENEVHYLQKEVSCLRDELHSVNKEKRAACERYKEAYVELSGIKNRSEREIESLREHLRLAMAALKEGQQLGNHLPH